MKVRSLVNTRDTLHQNLWRLSPSLYVLKINFRFNFSRYYLRYTVLVGKGEVSFLKEKKKKDDASCGYWNEKPWFMEHLLHARHYGRF